MYTKGENAHKKGNNREITLAEKAELVKKTSRNKIRSLVQHSKEVLGTCELLENKIDAIIEKVF